MSAFVANFLRFLLYALSLLVLGRVIASFVDPRGRHPLTSFVIGATEPILGPIRRALPSTSAIDFSPLVVMLVLSAAVRAIG